MQNAADNRLNIQQKYFTNYSRKGKICKQHIIYLFSFLLT